MSPRRRTMPRPAFTLLEVLLAMALGAIVLAALSVAIDFHLRVVARGRQSVEEAQLARALLRQMANDLRATVRYEPLDVSGLAGASGQIPSGTSQGSSGSNSQGSVGGSSSADGASDFTGESTSESDPLMAESAVMGTTPGLYGNLYEIQVDVSRLPRIDQYEQLILEQDGRPADLVSDVKTVAYFVGQSQDGAAMGLMRRELARAATSFAAANGGLMELEHYQQLIAPEVLAIEFSYFDGIDWLPEWDSSVNEGLPVAVEIAMAVSMSPEEVGDVSLIDLSMTTGEENYRVYRLLVHLPAGKPATTEEAMPLETTDSTSSSSSTGTTP